MPTFTTNTGVLIHYDIDGDRAGRPLVLIHGGGAQSIGWDDRFVAQLVTAGFFVIRPDNRDVGLSQMTAEPTDLTATYDLTDMADDVIAVLDELGIERAHLVGMSMGGFIVQLVAILHPTRAASLGLMSTTASSNPEFLVGVHGDGVPITALPEWLDRNAYIDMFIGGQRKYQSPGFPFDVDASTELAGRYYDRIYRPDGLLRQWNAMLAGPLERREALSGVMVPVTIIHGRKDQSVHWRAALEMAALLPQAELHVFEEMGHDVPRELWPDFINAFIRTANRVERTVHA